MVWAFFEFDWLRFQVAGLCRIYARYLLVRSMTLHTTSHICCTCVQVGSFQFRVSMEEKFKFKSSIVVKINLWRPEKWSDCAQIASCKCTSLFLRWMSKCEILRTKTLLSWPRPVCRLLLEHAGMPKKNSITTWWQARE